MPVQKSKVIDQSRSAGTVETGIVQNVRGKRATVAIARNSRCGGCKGCLLSGDGRYMVAEVFDGVGVSVGDEVEMSVMHFSQTAAAVLLFIIPIILFMISFFSLENNVVLGIQLVLSLLAGSLPYLYYVTHPRLFNMHITRCLVAHARANGDEGTSARVQID